MIKHVILPAALVALASAGFTSCAGPQAAHSHLSLSQSQAKTAPAPALYDWHGDNLAGPTTVKIRLDEQKAYIYRGHQEAGWTMLASGKAGHDSPTGTFHVLEKKDLKASTTYGVIADSEGHILNYDAQAGVTPVPPGCRFVGAPMPHWMRLTGNGVGMHAGNIPDPGMPASHGCIRLPPAMAEKLYSVISEGSKVEVTGIAPGSSLAGAPPRITRLVPEQPSTAKPAVAANAPTPPPPSILAQR